MILTIHETDLFRPHCDPDDHWDLACQFALHKMGLHRLMGVMIDAPSGQPRKDGLQPDISAVAQMNTITKACVPVGVGAPDTDPEIETSGSNLLLTTLREAPEKVTVHIVGSSRDVAVALRKAPELFREKCAGIFLNAGSGIENGLLEWNVNLDPASYAAIFSAPCPLYWMPCFEKTPDFEHGVDMTVGKFGTFYRFTMGEILKDVSPAVQNYFIHMLSRNTSTDWKTAIEKDVDGQLLEKFSAMPRNMWCTGGFLYAAGKGVDGEGNIVEKDDPASVFAFTPVSVKCDRTGHTVWEQDASSNQFIFTVRDLEAYPAAMTKAMKTILMTL